jgi:hypothetical protein
MTATAVEFSSSLADTDGAVRVAISPAGLIQFDALSEDSLNT